MSYILEALKKSERERETSNLETAAPAIESPFHAGVTSAPRGRYWWVIGFIASFVCIAFILIKFGRIEVSEEAQVQSANVNGELIQQKQSVKQIERSITAVDIPEEAVVKDIVKEVAETHDVSTVQPQIMQPAIAAEQAPENIQSLLPIIEVSSHIYSSLAERRSIVVNGERLVEADFITPEVQVKEITHQGMIVKVEGWSLVVSRSRGWSR
jgi:general secretion pathway protein B